jgi:hypothetical protein
MARFTKEERQQIVKDFAIRHNGQYNAALFLQEVREKGIEHPAFEWFAWDKDKAFDAYQLEQARDFASDLKVIFQVEEIGRNKTVKVKQVSMPMVISPVGGRHDGGGYFLTDPQDPAHRAEHRKQAALALRAWFNRYQAALIESGGSPEGIEKAIAALESSAASRNAA